eukprot:2371309-Karenia_brevis.AAC.1
MEERGKRQQRTREDMAKLKRGSKAWWSKAKKLMSLRQKASSIPALRAADGTWIKDPTGKANLFADAFASKFHVPATEEN